MVGFEDVVRTMNYYQLPQSRHPTAMLIYDPLSEDPKTGNILTSRHRMEIARDTTWEFKLRPA
jgi:hypothetical protein